MEVDQYNQTIQSMLPSLAKTLLYEVDISRLEKSITSESVQVSADTMQPRLFGTLILGAGIALGARAVYDWATSGFQSNFDIAEKVINNARPGSEVHQQINVELDLDRSASIDETRQAFEDTSFHRKNRLSHDIIQISALEDVSADAAIEQRDAFRDTAVEGGKVGLTTTVGAYTTVTGGQAIDKIVKFLGMSEKAAALFDLLITYAGSQPLDILGEMLAEEFVLKNQSKETKTVKVPPSELSNEDAIKILSETAQGDLSKVSDVEQLNDAFDTTFGEIAKNLPNTITTEDGGFVTEVPVSTHIEHRNQVNSGDSIQILDLGPSDLVITAKDTMPQVIEDIKLDESTELALELEEASPPPALTLSSQLIRSDGGLTNYRVAASVFGVSAPTTVIANVRNASVMDAIKSLSHDGTVTWMATVLDKDGYFTVTRNDTGEALTLTLPSQNSIPSDQDQDQDQDHDGRYEGWAITTHESVNWFCIDYEMQVVVSGNSMSGDVTGVVNGDDISGSGPHNTQFSGTIIDGKMTGNWSNEGCSGTFTLNKYKSGSFEI
ncbi:hypothetical protein U5801_14035 [Lamprobacter modestohalophilus]|uniref:hypothetical protein n=1 Tax=Lamprobacter modestohalophilus TaxID=1064514 RepID=UPI002ADEDF79|nr:hypothetical protein [Lamprobacter modestohalophilus]MEA1050918.1 hypothetical protein [Lamprobacter modestohalophilus]